MAKRRKIIVSKLQYITQQSKPEDIFKEVKSFLTGGGDWVQLRMKDASKSVFLQTAHMIKELCFAYNATFIINDNVEIALECKADGVHLGKGDMPTSVVREWVGDGMIIGRTANTARDIEILSKQKIDYIGLGPYKYTTTKKNIAEVLGLDGYKSIFDELKAKDVIFPPIVAIGSVGIEDIEPLSDIKDIYGIAVSGSIAKADNPVKATMNMIETLEKYMY